MSNLSTLPKGDSAWLLRKAIERIMEQVSVLETNIGSSTTGNSANTQIIFNDNGTLRGDTGLTYDKGADRLSFGAGICYGDLTVDTSTLKVDSTNHRVGIGTATPSVPLYVTGNNATATAIMQDETNGAKLRLLANSINFDITNGGGGGEIAVSGANPLTFKTNGTERARIDSSGNLGIGVTPSAWSGGFKGLQISGGYGSIGSNANADTRFYSGGFYGTLGNTYAVSAFPVSMYQQSGGIHSWHTAAAGTAGNAITDFASAKMTLTAAGEFLVGTTSTSVTNGGVVTYGSSVGQLALGHATGTGSGNAYAGFQYAGTEIGSITQNGTTGVLYNIVSDYRLKESVVPLSGGLARVNALKPSVYNWKSDGSTGEGFLAHELAEVVPFAVSGEKDAVNADGTIRSQGIDMSRIVPILVAAIQELTARVQTLEAR